MAAQNDRAEPPIFVIGTPRSGTTLTARPLANHSRVFIPAETRFFDDIYARRRQLGDPANPTAMRGVAERLSTLYRRQHEGQYQKQFKDLLEDPVEIMRRMGPCKDYRDVTTRFIGIQMRGLGYQPETIAMRRMKAGILLLGFPFALVRGLFANRSKQAALLPYLAKRLAPLFGPSRLPS